MGILNRIFGGGRGEEIEQLKSEFDERLKSIEERLDKMDALLLTLQEERETYATIDALMAMQNEIRAEVQTFRKDIELAIHTALEEQRHWVKEIVEEREIGSLIVTPEVHGDKRKKVNDEELIKLYEQGLPKTEIAKLLGVSRQTVYNRLKKLEEEGMLPKIESHQS